MTVFNLQFSLSISNKAKLVQTYPCPILSSAKKYGHQRSSLQLYLYPWSDPGGFTLHMTGYAPACTKSVEKGSFLDIRRRRRLLQKGYIFAAYRNLGVLKWVELLRAENGIWKQHFENLCKIVKKHDMRFVFIWNIKENEVWHICISSFSV